MMSKLALPRCNNHFEVEESEKDEIVKLMHKVTHKEK